MNQCGVSKGAGGTSDCRNQDHEGRSVSHDRCIRAPIALASQCVLDVPLCLQQGGGQGSAAPIYKAKHSTTMTAKPFFPFFLHPCPLPSRTRSLSLSLLLMRNAYCSPILDEHMGRERESVGMGQGHWGSESSPLSNGEVSSISLPKDPLGYRAGRAPFPITTLTWRYLHATHTHTRVGMNGGSVSGVEEAYSLVSFFFPPYTLTALVVLCE